MKLFIKKYLFLLGVAFATQVTCAQYNYSTNDSLFSQAISKNFKKYKKESKKAFNTYNFKRGRFLFDSLVNNCLKSKSFDDFKAKKLNGKTININSYFEKPTILITYASWCVIPEGEQNAINDLAKEHQKEIDFVVLFWDIKKNARKASKGFNNAITVLFIDEKENVFNKEVKLLKHTFGFPTSFYLDHNNKVSHIERPSHLKSSMTLKLKNYTNTYASIEEELKKIAPNIKTTTSELVINE